jgi:hypothetical protein
VIGENRAADSPLKHAKESVKQYQHAFKVRERDMVRLFGILLAAHHLKIGRAQSLWRGLHADLDLLAQALILQRHFALAGSAASVLGTLQRGLNVT